MCRLYTMHKLFAFLLLAFANAYPLCNDIYQQHEYLEKERHMFSISTDKSPFDGEYLFDTTRFHPTSCMTENGLVQRLVEGSCKHISDNTALVLQPATHRLPLFDSLVWKMTDALWYLSGWTKIIEDGEHYWFYPNETTDKTVFYLHGVNVVNGFENIVLLRKLARQASVYVSIYSPVLFFDADYNYYHTYSEHIDNVASFIRRYKTYDTDIIGNSYGTIRTTTLCKRYPDLCHELNHIVLTDPLNLNLPFSKMFDACLYGVFFVHPEKTPIYRRSVTINTLRLERYYRHLYNYMDWWEWSIDTELLHEFADTMVLVIGDHDKLISVERNSPAMQLCRVIYTNTRHGMVIFTDFMEQIYDTCPNQGTYG